MKKLIILNGTGGAGKDTFYKYISEYLFQHYNQTSIHYSYVEFTREMLKEYGIDPSEKTAKYRQLLATINHALTDYRNIPLRDCCSLIDDMLFKRLNDDPYEYCVNPNEINCIFLDVREPLVIDSFKKLYPNTATILIDNGRINNSTNEDKNVKNYLYDYVIFNVGSVDELQSQAEHIAEKLRNTKNTIECDSETKRKILMGR